jgi:hypothetical protein
MRIGDPGSCQPWIRDGKIGSGSGINIPAPQHCYTDISYGMCDRYIRFLVQTNIFIACLHCHSKILLSVELLTVSVFFY